MRNEKKVRFLYRGSLASGEVFDDCEGQAHEIVLGRRQVMPALEEALSQMRCGEERVVELCAQQAYGEHDPDAVQSFPACRVPNGENIPAGATIGWTSPRSAKPIPAKVVSVANKVVTLDFNHPLAGQDIVYWIKLLEIVEEENPDRQGEQIAA